MEASSIFAHPVIWLPINHNPHPITVTFATQSVAVNVSSDDVQNKVEIRKNHYKLVSKHQKKNTLISREARDAAILEVQNSSDLASALLRLGDILKTQDLNVVLRHFGNQKRWKDLSQLFDWMHQHEKTNIASYSSYIRFIGRDSNSMKALEIYNSIKDESMRNNASVCNATLHCLIKSGKFYSSLKLFNHMKQAGLVPDIITYSTLLAGCARVKGGYVKAMELVHEIKSRGLHMDDIVYGALISVCASNNQYEEAEKYFYEMKSEGHSLNVFHYSSLLNACAADGNYKKADELIQEMQSAGMILNKVILTTLLKVYVKGGLFEKSRELLNKLQAQGYAEDEMAYCLLMDGLAKSGKLDEAKSVFDEMREKEVKNDGYSYSIMITALCRNRLVEEAKQLAYEYEIKHGKYDVVILNSMLCAYCRSGDMDNVMKTMKKMDESAISPDWNTFDILIKYFCNEQLYMLAYRTMEDMHKRGHRPEEGLAISLINNLGSTRAQSEAFSVYNMLKYSKRTMNKYIHEKILRILLSGGLLKDAYVVVKDHGESISHLAVMKFATSFMKNGNINLVNDVIKSIHNSGHKLDQDLFRMAISRYIEQSDKNELLLHLLQWMHGQGYCVDSSTRNLILNDSHLSEHHSVTELLCKQHALPGTRNSNKRTK